MRIGTRSSKMALQQTEMAAKLLSAVHNGMQVNVVRFSPPGDRDQVSKLEKHGGKGGAFVAEIRDAMRGRALDAAMHSLKDMPGDEEAPGLVIAAMLKREPIEDALILHPDCRLDEFLKAKGANAKIGTNSVRRAAYLRRLFPGAEIIHYRGAADTRVKKLDGRVLQKLPDGGKVGPADALVMARCGLERVGLAGRIAHIFRPDEMLPAVGQGIVALECRRDDWKTRERLAAVDDAAARACGNAERELLWVLNGHCNAPIAGNAQINAGLLVLRAAVISEDGARILQCSVSGPKDRAREVGREAGLKLLEQGARDIIEASRPPVHF